VKPIDEFRKRIDSKSSGADFGVGMVNNFRDVQAALEFARGLLN
jgi:hypothetical protein